MADPDLFTPRQLAEEEPRPMLLSSPQSEKVLVVHVTVEAPAPHADQPDHRRYWRDRLAHHNAHRRAYRPAWKGG